MSGYIGRTPLSEAIQSRAKYTATANQTTFSFSYQPGFLDVYLNGIKIEDTTDYTATTGTEIVLTSGAAAGDVLEAVGLSTFSLLTGKHNYSATAAPTTGDDSADGYRVGSMWIDTTNDEAYRCVDDTVGAAVWIGTTLETTDLGSLAMVTPTGTGSTSTFLRGDNSWTTVNTDLVADTTPQLGGNLDTNAKNINFGDSTVWSANRATFGASSDLQIYHDGNNSFIGDYGGTGSIFIQTGDQLYLQADHGENYIVCNKDGTVNLYHDNAMKLQTLSYGIDVTGRITTDGITEDASGNVGIGTSNPTSDLHIYNSIPPAQDTYSGVHLEADGYGYMVEGGIQQGHGSVFKVSQKQGGTKTERMRIDSSGRVTMPYQPGFHIASTSAYNGTGFDGTFTDVISGFFNQSIYNTGNHFNTSNGLFTAPVSGTYIFNASLHCNGTFSQIWFVKNGSRDVTTHSISGNTSGDVIALCGILKLNANDTVGLHLYKGSGSATQINTNNLHSWFKGHLIG